jgi:hypothetical protein
MGRILISFKVNSSFKLRGPLTAAEIRLIRTSLYRH